MCAVKILLFVWDDRFLDLLYTNGCLQNTYTGVEWVKAGRRNREGKTGGDEESSARGKIIFTAFILPTQTRDLNTSIRAEMDGAIIRPEGKVRRRKEK